MNNYKRVTILAAIAGLVGTALVVTTRVRAQSIAAITVLQDVKMESYPGPVIKSGQRLESVAGFGKALLERDDSAYATVPGFHYRLLQMADGRKIDVFDPIQAKTTYYQGSPSSYAANEGRAVSNQCATPGDHIDGVESVMGVRVVKVERMSADREITRWLALDSGCLEVQAIITWKDAATGAVTAKTSYTLSNGNRGRSSGVGFNVPDCYTESSPGQVQAKRLAVKYGSLEAAKQACSDCVGEAFEGSF
jgi:hypothetical protein